MKFEMEKMQVKRKKKKKTKRSTERVVSLRFAAVLDDKI